MRLPHFHLPSFNFRNPFRRANQGAGTDAAGTRANGAGDPGMAQAGGRGRQEAAGARNQHRPPGNLGGTRPAGPESLRAPDHVLRQSSLDPLNIPQSPRTGAARSRVSFADTVTSIHTGAEAPETSPLRNHSGPGSLHSRTDSPPPVYSETGSPVGHYTDPPRERHPDDFLTESPPPSFHGSPVPGEHTLDINHNRMELSPQAVPFPRHAVHEDDIPELHLDAPPPSHGGRPLSPIAESPVAGSPNGSLTSLELDRLLDALGPLSHFPTPPPR
jgi:hypothetical protein